MEFAAGDVVYLKSGGPAMTVTEVIAPLHHQPEMAYRVSWFAGRRNETGVFPGSALTKAPPGKVPETEP
jgi:uncharacterized protein YodC (DUF2158 family)